MFFCGLQWWSDGGSWFVVVAFQNGVLSSKVIKWWFNRGLFAVLNGFYTAASEGQPVVLGSP